MRKEYAIEIWSRKIFCVILIRMFWGCAISEAQNNWYKDKLMYAIFARVIIVPLNLYLAIKTILNHLMF